MNFIELTEHNTLQSCVKEWMVRVTNISRYTITVTYFIRSQEKNSNQNRNSNLGPGSGSKFFLLRSYNVKFPKANKLWVWFQLITEFEYLTLFQGFLFYLFLDYFFWSSSNFSINWQKYSEFVKIIFTKFWDGVFV